MGELGPNVLISHAHVVASEVLEVVVIVIFIGN